MEHIALIKSVASVITRELGLDYPDNRIDELVRGLERTAAMMGGGIGYLDIANEILNTRSIPENIYTPLSVSLTINETYFFREKPAMEFFQEVILKEIRETNGNYIIWSAGCSSGEEPYTIAILLKERLTSQQISKVKIIATDISDKALQKARMGAYTQWSFRETPEHIQQKYFSHKGNEWQICKEIQEMVTFGHLNLFKDSYTKYFNGRGSINLIFCRNVLMYFSHDNIKSVSHKFHDMLYENGWFVTSQVELNNELFGNFGKVYSHGALFYRKTEVQLLPAVNLPTEETCQNFNAISSKFKRIRTIPKIQDKKVPPLPPAMETHAFNYQTATEYAGRGEFDKAIEILDNLISGEDLKPEFFYLYGTIYSEMGKNREAADMLKKALYLDPGNVLSSFLLGNIYKNDGKNEQAKKFFANAYESLTLLDPGSEIDDSGGLTAARLAEVIKANLS